MFHDKRKLTAGLISAVALVLTGCGGGSSSGSDSGSGSESGSSITAIDGYLTNANVYLDANANGLLDPEEQTAGAIGQTGAQGVFVLDDQYAESGLLVQAVAGQTIDSDSGIVGTTFVLSAEAGSSVVTPFTHLANVTGNSLADVALTLGVDESVITGDYIALKSATQTQEDASIAHALARFVVTELKQGNVDEATISSSLGDAKTAIESAISAGTDADLVEVELDDSNSGAVVEAPTSALVFTETFLQSESSWSAYRFDDNGDNEQFYFRFGNANDQNAFCIASEPMTFLDPATIGPFDDACTGEGTFSVNESGQLALSFSSADTFDMLYRHSEEVPTPEGGTELYRMFLMIKSNGELLWVDNKLSLRDPSDYAEAPANKVFSITDDNGTRGEIDPILAVFDFETTGSTEDPTYGTLNEGTVTLSSLVDSTDFATTNWDVSPLCVELGFQCQGSDDALSLLERSNESVDEHAFLIYRSAGQLDLIWDHKPYDQGTDESLFVQSESRALIELIYNAFIERDNGTQGTN